MSTSIPRRPSTPASLAEGNAAAAAAAGGEGEGEGEEEEEANSLARCPITQPRTRTRTRTGTQSKAKPYYEYNCDDCHESLSRKRPRRFAPLDPKRQTRDQDGATPAAAAGVAAPKLEGIVFDVDGTLCLPQNYMFRLMRETLQIQKPTDILTHIRSLPISPPSAPTLATPLNHQGTAMLAIRAIEREAMAKQTPQPGLLELMTYLEQRGVRKALCTRNFPAPVTHLCDTFMPGIRFWPVITRDTTDVLPKPSPMGIWRIAESWGLGGDGAEPEAEQDAARGARAAALDTVINPTIRSAPATDGQESKDNFEEARILVSASSPTSQSTELDPLELERARRRLGGGLIMVGDSLDDMAAGYRAGAATILLESEETEKDLLDRHEYVDLVVRRLDEIIPVLEAGFLGRS